MNKWMEEQYEALGISREVYEFGEKIEDSLKERFAAIDATAEYNQLKVIKAMQDNRVSAECFNMSSGYGYNDLGRDTLEKVYASCFKGEDALVRPQITCGTHALALALMSNLRPGDELLAPAGKPYDTRALWQNMVSLTVRWIFCRTEVLILNISKRRSMSGQNS